jgi:hypothetical protein
MAISDSQSFVAPAPSNDHASINSSISFDSSMTHDIESQSNTNLNNMSYSILLDSSFEDTPPCNESSSIMAHPAAYPLNLPPLEYDQLILQGLMEPAEHHSEGPDFLQPLGMNDSISSITPQNIGIDKDYQASEDDVVATTMNGGNSLVPSADYDNDSIASSQQVDDDIASLEGYLDDMIFGEDPSIEDFGNVNTMEEEVMNNDLRPNYVECFQAKELLQMLLENELPPVFKSQIDKLHPAEEELVIIMRKNNSQFLCTRN